MMSAVLRPAALAALLLLPCPASTIAAQVPTGASTYLFSDNWIAWISESGRDTVRYRNELDRQQMLAMERIVQAGSLVDSMVTLAERHILVSGLRVRARPCGARNAMYDPRDDRIDLCYELLLDVLRLESPEATEVDELDMLIMARASRFFFAHELAHAVIHRYRLPVLGDPEVAADQFALWLLARDGDEIALRSAAIVFADFALNESWTMRGIESAHGLTLARRRRIQCWIDVRTERGRVAPDGTAVLIEADEAARCEREVATVEAAWSQLLAPYLAESGDDDEPYDIEAADEAYRRASSPTTPAAGPEVRAASAPGIGPDAPPND